MKPARISAIALIGLVAIGIASCRAPTNVIVTVTTDMDCKDFKGATVTVGQLSSLESVPESTESTTCDANKRIGSVVLEPSAAEDGAIAFRVVGGLGRDVESCTPPYGPGCIVSRRALKYFPHDSLRVNVRLESSCSGIPCGTTETCVGGACYPATIDPSACKGAGCDDSVVTNGAPASFTSDPVRHLAIDDTYLYWGDRANGNLVRQRKDLGAAPQILDTPANGGNASPNGLVLVNGEIWWGSQEGGLYHCPIDGCPGNGPTQVAFLVNQTVESVAVAGNTVYFTTIVDEKGAGAKGDLYFCPVTGCPDPSNPPIFYETPEDAARVVVDSNNVYWTRTDTVVANGGAVRQCPLSQGGTPCQAPTLLADNQYDPWGLWVDASTVYWVTHGDGQVLSCAIGGCNNQPTVLAQNQGHPYGMSVDGGTIYWADETDGKILKCDIASCTPTLIADGQGLAWDVIADPSYVYWANGDFAQGGVFRLPK